MKRFHRMLMPVAASVALLAGCSGADDIDSRVESILSQMTLEEKIQIIHAQSKFSSAGVPRLGIPELWMDDGPHGVRPDTYWNQWEAAGFTNDSVTAYPALTCLAASWSREIAGVYGRSVGEEARYRGKNVLLGPGINICRTPLCGRNFEYMGEDPFLAGNLAAEYVKGVQSNAVAVCLKHFALNNQENYRHNNNVIVSDRALYEIYLDGFRTVVDKAHPWSVMGAYNLYNNQHLCHNEVILNEVLKGEWNYDGAVISDWGGCHDTDEAIVNGLDLEMGTGTNGVDVEGDNEFDHYYLARPYREKVKSGEVGEDELNDKCRRVLRLMLRTEKGGKMGWGSLNTQEHWADARRIGTEGIVLLKNDNNVLPICAAGNASDGSSAVASNSLKKIVVLGENAIKPMAVGGSSSSLKAQHEVTILDGIRNALPGVEVVYERAYVGEPIMNHYNYSNYDISDPRTKEELLADALAAVKDADKVIFVGGLNKHHRQDCEGDDREDYHLPYGQDEIIDVIATVRPDMIFVGVSGSQYAMPWRDKVSGIVQAWYLHSEAGNALADVLTGAVNPSGKLPFTFPVELSDGPVRTEAQYPGIKRGNGIIDTEYSEGIYVGYRWYEANGIKPMFPFGYGLSYTEFKYGDVSCSGKIRSGRSDAEVRVPGSGSMTVSIPVTNVGKVAGAEIVQLYIQALDSSVDRPVKELKGFDKVYIEPGETKTVKISFGSDALSYFDGDTHSWVCESGRYKVIVAASSEDIRAEKEFVVK